MAVDDAVRRIADAVLYEGYLLWPYRKSALKNQQRFTFGGVYPPAWEDSSCMQMQVLLENSKDLDIDVRTRFLQIVERKVFGSDGPLALGGPVDELESDGKRFISGEEAVEREVEPGPIRIEAGERIEQIPDGEIRRSWSALSGELSLRYEPLRRDLWKITVCVQNTTPLPAASQQHIPGWSGYAEALRGIGLSHAEGPHGIGRSDTKGPRGSGLSQTETSHRIGLHEHVLRHTFCSTHTVLRARSGKWVSPTDPPAALRADAQACQNTGTWPVLVGEQGDTSTLLAAPIILSDYPEIAPESPGDLFDSGEIDQLLVLSILTMTDEERREMRDCDPRAREILERTEALTEEQIMRLHGAVREFGLVRTR